MGSLENPRSWPKPRDDQLDEQEALERETRARWETFRPSFVEWAKASGESLSEFDRLVDSQVEFAIVKFQKERAARDLNGASVSWDKLTRQDGDRLQELLDCNPREEELHCFLDDYPQFLVQVLAGGHGRFQLSNRRLGSEFVPDFLVAEMSSIGIEWHAVEIESSCFTVVRKDGRPTSQVHDAVNQIRDWRQWLMNNLGYARSPKEQNGLGLVGIDARLSGLIVIGRRQEYSIKYNEFRRQMIDRERIVIHSYDWLVDAARSNSSGNLSWELRQPE